MRPLLIERLQIQVRVQADITALEHLDRRQIQNAKIEGRLDGFFSGAESRNESALDRAAADSSAGPG
jgi:hypothetical protein